MAVFTEGKARLSAPKGVFFNPEMALCRSIFSLAVGALPREVSVLDAMCASGARGIRYALENRNVSSLVLCDASSSAVLCARRNAARNKLKCKVVKADARRLLEGTGCDFIELDPFGSPQPFLHSAAVGLSGKDDGYLSATATDMAVLCGAHHAACLKNYLSVPLDNEFCHENAVRILCAAVVRELAPLNLCATPVFSLSHRHYVKILFHVGRGAEKAVSSVKLLGFCSYCPKCCLREWGRLPPHAACQSCGAAMLHAGPMYLGKLWDGALVERMLEKNASRGYGQSGKIEAMLSAILAESGIGSCGYYDLHTLAKKWGGKILSMDDALERVRASGFPASRTHFCPTAIRTSAPYGKLREALME